MMLESFQKLSQPSLPTGRILLASALLVANLLWPGASSSAGPATRLADDQIQSLSVAGGVKLRVGHQKLLRTSAKIRRAAIVDSNVCAVVQYSAGEIALVGRAAGETDVVIWFDDPATAPLACIVVVK